MAGILRLFRPRAGGRLRATGVSALAFALALPGAALCQGAPPDDKAGKAGGGGEAEEQDVIQINSATGAQAYIGKIKKIHPDKMIFEYEGVEIEIKREQFPQTEQDRHWGRGKGGGVFEEAIAAGGGKQVEATRFFFKNGSVIVGLVLRESPKYIWIRRKGAPELRLFRKDVDRTEPVMVPETMIYTLDGIYHRRKAEITPQNGRDHFQLAEEMEKVGYWAKAREHYERAMLLDERYEERAKEKMTEVRAAQLDSEARHLDHLITCHVRADRADRLVDAIRMIKQLAELNPDSPIRTKWEALIPELEVRLKKMLRRVVVNSYYQKMKELIREWVWGRVVIGAEIPGVVIAMKRGTKVQGKLLEDGDEFIVIEDEYKGRIEIAKDMVVDIRHVNLNKRRRDPTLAESRQYVEDTSAGITADLLKELEEEFKDRSTESLPVGQEQIQEFWKDRLTRVVTITTRGTTQVVAVSSIHEAHYGGGTWLRDGGAGGDLGGLAVPVGAGGGAGGGGGRRGQSGGGGQAQEVDPERWWRVQKREVRYELLKAFAAEALCEVMKVVKLRCPACGGTGTRLVVSMGADGTGNRAEKTCSTCRGLRTLVKIRYK